LGETFPGALGEGEYNLPKEKDVAGCLACEKKFGETGTHPSVEEGGRGETAAKSSYEGRGKPERELGYGGRKDYERGETFRTQGKNDGASMS